MSILKHTALLVFVMICFHASGQGKKERIFICKSDLYEDEHTSDAKFNSLVDNACTEINQKHYKDGQRQKLEIGNCSFFVIDRLHNPELFVLVYRIANMINYFLQSKFNLGIFSCNLQ